VREEKRNKKGGEDERRGREIKRGGWGGFEI
jgi:hypothetical protein